MCSAFFTGINGDAMKWCYCLLLALVALNAQAGIVWNESINGDFSSNGLAPSAVNVAVGTNTILGATGNPGSGVDRDYFKITVPNGSVLSAVNLLSSTTISGGASFMGIQPGPQLTVTPSGGGVENLIAIGHYSLDQIGTNILPDMIIGTNNGTLPSGTYSVWVQELGGPVSYGFDFVITPVAAESLADAPIPSWTYAVLTLILIGVMAHQGRRRLSSI